MISVQTQFPLAFESNDHIYPEGIYYDNWVNFDFVNQILRVFRRPIKVLDIGCAGGNLVLEFAKRGCLAVGIDGSDQCLKPDQNIVENRGFLPNGFYNWQENYNKFLFNCDISKPYQIMENHDPLNFDLITTWDTLEHIHPDSIDLTLEMVSNHLEEGGLFLGNVALFSSLGRGYTPEIEYHQSVFPKDWWIQKLEKYFYLVKYPVEALNRPCHPDHYVFAAIRYPRKKLRKTVVSHFYNEEYLLPWWLDHHKNMFDHGILIDYGSTDRSVEIIRKICPHWTIIKSRNNNFDTHAVDDEVMDVMGYIDGFKIVLNITEFLVGNMKILDESKAASKIYIPCLVMCDPPCESSNDPNYDKPLYKQKYHGLHYEQSYPIRYYRILHNGPEPYVNGRHYWVSNPEFRLAILWYGWSPYNQKLLARRKQTRDRMPPVDPNDPDSVINGSQHRWTEDQEKNAYLECVNQTQDLRPILRNIGCIFDEV